jgi:glyoxylase-like metal-dependent hydrolase (beta-lactamase superfamily II)
MTLEIVMLPLGALPTNAYLVGDTETNRAIVIDPVDEAGRIIAEADAHGWTIGLILATHAHWDHVLASGPLAQATGAPFWLHEDAAPMLEAVPARGVQFTGRPFPAPAVPARLLTRDEPPITLDAITLRPLYTPGHAPGHLAFLLDDGPESLEGVVFAGDALFQGSIGRTDLPGGSMQVLMDSIFTHLLTLDDRIVVLSGHGDPTTIGQERAHNPYLLAEKQRRERGG